MKYLGGKSRIAKPIAEVILGATSQRATYVEPFIGGGSVAARLAPHFDRAYISDASPDLIALWSALQRGWEPPSAVSRETHSSLKSAPVSPLRGFVGYGCSFGGMWFHSYAQSSKGENFALQSRNSLLRKIANLRTAMIYQASYDRAMIPVGSVVYLDPPYANTFGYERTGGFDSATFWSWAEGLSRRSRVFVSEYAAPEGWLPIWEGRPQAGVAIENKGRRATERLWVRG